MRRFHRFTRLIVLCGATGFLLAGCAYETGPGVGPTGTNAPDAGMSGASYVHPNYNNDGNAGQQGAGAQGEDHGGFGGGGGATPDGDGDGDGQGGGMR